MTDALRPQTVLASLSRRITGHEGVWHAFVRGSREFPTEELVVIHDDVYASELVGTIGVDSGSAGVFDVKCPRREPNGELYEGTLAALGVVSMTGYGDGTYGVFVGRHKGSVAKIRLPYVSNAPEVDLSVAKAHAEARPYSTSARFALGDTIEHVKFGTGSVVRVGGDGKIDVRFADGTRTLVHARK